MQLAICKLALIVRRGNGQTEMADTVVSMAKSLLGSAISKAATAAAAEMSLLMGVKKDIW